MKPTFLQDAIKANALKKIQKRERGEWKEPVIKQHKMSAEEFRVAKQLEKPKSFSTDGACAAPTIFMPTPAGPDPKTIKMIEATQAEMKSYQEENKVLRSNFSNVKNEFQSLRNEMKSSLDENWKLREDITALQYELESLREDMKEQIKSATKKMITSSHLPVPPSPSKSNNNNAEVESALNILKAELKKVRSEMSTMRDEILSLQKTNKNLQEELKIAKKPVPERYSTPVRERSSQSINNAYVSPAPSLSARDGPSPSLSTYSTPLSSPQRSSIFKNGSSSNVKKNENLTLSLSSPQKSSTSKVGNLSSVSKKPEEKKSETTFLSIEPFTPEKLEFHQRKDEALKSFIKTKEGLYPMKKMSIQEMDKYNIVCFKKRVYIPMKLREKTIEHYKKTYRGNALEKLQETCIWPTLEHDYNVAVGFGSRQ